MNASHPYVIFELAGSTYGVPSDGVQHVEMLEHITRVPDTAPAVDGVVFSRGHVVPALNLRARFGLPREAPSLRSRLIFVKVEQRTVALVVDAAREFRVIPRESIRPIEQTLHGIEGNYVAGVATVKDRLVLLLDVPALLRLDDLDVGVAPAAVPSAS